MEPRAPLPVFNWECLMPSHKTQIGDSWARPVAKAGLGGRDGGVGKG